MTERDSLSESPGSLGDKSTASAPPPPSGLAFKDRRVALVAFGVLQLLIAVGILAMAALQLLMAVGGEAFAPSGGVPVSRAPFIGSGLFYLALGAIAIVLGIGSIRCRRWARALTLLLASFGLAIGVASAVILGLTMPGMIRTMEGQMGGAQPGVGFVVGCMVVGLGLVYLILPAAFVLFYRSRHVKATCEFYDPKPRWTDRRPLPVLAGSLVLLSGCSAILTPWMGLGMPFFGSILSGGLSWLVVGIFAITTVVLAWGFFNLRRWAWLGALVFMAVNGLNGLLTFSGNGLLDLYERLEIPSEQLEMMQTMGLVRLMAPMMAVSLVLLLGFYLWLGRYFKADAGEAAGG